MSLQRYRKKRDFTKTCEPKGRTLKQHGKLFVVQEHHASHLHWDFRLELNGVLKSWAVPKGPSMNPKVKRLAVEVEDHPIPYADFEGRIPKGEYGAGTVKCWDRGEWFPTGAPATSQLRRGHLEFELKGKRLNGRWLLVRTERNNWLLINRGGGAEVRELPAFIPPQLAALSKAPPVGPQWIHEIKFDGYRTGCRIDHGQIKLLTRSGLDWTDKYAPLASDCQGLKAESAYLDGEVVWIDGNGKSQFQGLQESLGGKNLENIYYYVFDLLYFNEEDLQSEPLKERKAALKDLLKNSNCKRILFSEHWAEPGRDIYKAACNLDLEGIISKDSTSPYAAGQRGEWLKSKCKHVQEFVIGGYTLQANTRVLGAILVGAYDPGGMFRYLGRVGTGFGGASLLPQIKRLVVKKSPFVVHPPPRSRSVIFVKPQLVVNVEFGAWSDAKILRHASFKGVREDKKAGEVFVEEASAVKLPKLSHPQKILFSKSKSSKQDLATYYRQIQNQILPHITRRPLAILRCPEGAGKTCFFQKHVQAPGILNGKFKVEKKMEQLISIDSIAGLYALVQMGALELHARGCHLETASNPDLVVFDFDPDPSVKWPAVKRAALRMKALLDHLQLISFIKVTGGKGLHIHVPIEPRYSWTQIKMFAKTLCEQMVQENPDLYTVTISKAQRHGKIFLDYLRNGNGATAVVPYSVRAKPDAPVALPISWQELEDIRGSAIFKLATSAKLVAQRIDPWDGYFSLRQTIRLFS